jgi:hypothetical protein
MEVSGVSAECADCSLHEEDTCCGRRTGLHCDAVILFLNLKLGCSLTVQDAMPNLCSFISENGCTLRVRPILCVNFTCKRLRDNIPHQKLVQIHTVAGDELDTLFAIENVIKRRYITLPAYVKDSITGGKYQ